MIIMYSYTKSPLPGVPQDTTGDSMTVNNFSQEAVMSADSSHVSTLDYNIIQH